MRNALYIFVTATIPSVIVGWVYGFFMGWARRSDRIGTVRCKACNMRFPATVRALTNHAQFHEKEGE